MSDNEHIIKTSLELPDGSKVGVVTIVSDFALPQKFINDIYKTIVPEMAKSLVSYIFMEGIDAISKKNNSNK